MSSVIIMCQQGIPFRLSPVRTQMVDELSLRGMKVIIFFPGIVDDKIIRSKTYKIVNTKRMDDSLIRTKIKKLNPDVVICTTIEDAILCFPLPHKMRSTDFYYYNLEIYVQSRRWKPNNLVRKCANRIDYMQNKLKEIIYVKGCNALVIQDRLRREISRKYWISHPITWLIPNSYPNVGHRSEVQHKDGVIYSGLMSNDVLKSFVRQLDDIKDIKITMSGWGCTELRKIRKNPNIKVIHQKLSDDEYTEFISAYDIGLIWYESENDDNIYNIGLSSGKFFKHLSLGQPVISNNAPGLGNEIMKYNLGIVINDLSELPNAVKTIYDNYDFYVRNIRQTYKRKYDYKKVSKKFFDEVTNGK